MTRRNAMKQKSPIELLKSRREFLKSLARKAAIPVVVVYTIQRSTPKLFAREPL
jgi:hypothetical protein